MQGRRVIDAPLLVGCVFGCANLLLAWLRPVDDDTPWALLRFYGPVFLLWAAASFHTARPTGRLGSGVTTGIVVALGTFLVFDLFVLLRVNVLLHALTGRPDWQNMMARFQASDFQSLRWFVNLDYAKEAPLRLLVACAIGALMGSLGGLAGRRRAA